MFFRDSFFYMAGIGFLALAKAKNILKGYSTPKPYDISSSEKCIEYDLRVVEDWLTHLRRYSPDDNTLAGKSVLELGPGSDLGIGIYLLSKGCSQYNACDVNSIMSSTPDKFYEELFRKLESINSKTDISFLKKQLTEAKAGRPSRLNYQVRKDFDILSSFGRASIDLVLSQAAFEHFDDINATVSQLSSVCKPGARLAVLVDLKTHSRWIRDKDPNNIYRYSKCVYNAFWFRGIPNRVRPFQYKEALERFGWKDISITPLTKIKDHYKSCSGMNKAFAEKKNQMDCLSIMICARKPEK